MTAAVCHMTRAMPVTFYRIPYSMCYEVVGGRRHSIGMSEVQRTWGGVKRLSLSLIYFVCVCVCFMLFSELSAAPLSPRHSVLVYNSYQYVGIMRLCT